jgi:pyruvate-formate lyase-activating enzyme
VSAAHQIIRLIESAPEIPKKRDYYREVDRFVRELRNEFETGYGSDSLAKLVLLKVSNLLVSYHACHHCHTQLVGHPTQILLDSANTCQLQCPGCVHSASYQDDWPKGIMQLNLCDSILREYGYFALAAELYNYGEPLINPNFPEMVRRAKRMGLHTVTSSNLSLRFDVEAVVQSGLDSLLMSVDGASRETLGIYRRRARFELCLENMRALADAKRRSGRRAPELVWKFLTFEHNCHEVPAAIAIAEEIGIDALVVATPCDVSYDDPRIRVHESEHAGRYSFSEHGPLDSPATLELAPPEKDAMDGLFFEGWVQRMQRLGVEEETSRTGEDTCDWLYQSLTFDAHGRVRPCCLPPSSHRHLVFSHAADGPADVLNSPCAVESRLLLTDKREYGGCHKSDESMESYCAECAGPPGLMNAVAKVGQAHLQRLDRDRVLSIDACRALTNWGGS